MDCCVYSWDRDTTGKPINIQHKYTAGVLQLTCITVASRQFVPSSALFAMTRTPGCALCQSPGEFHCSFEEEPICMFTQDKNDDFDWTRHSAATRDTKYTPNTGPSADHSGSKQGEWFKFCPFAKLLAKKQFYTWWKEGSFQTYPFSLE